MAKTVEAGGEGMTGFDGWIGKVTFEETPTGIKMSGYRRRMAQPTQAFEPRIVVFTPWANVKWVEYADTPPPLVQGDGETPRPARSAAKDKTRPLGEQP